MPNSLDALRDIHLPGSLSWWPLAFGYWVLLAALLVVMVLWFRRYRRFAIRRAAQQELDRVTSEYSGQDNSHDLARKVNVWLRRAVLSLEPRHEVASLTGEDWIAHVQSCSTNAAFTFSEGVVKLLTEGVYQAKVDVDADTLLQECRAWVRSLPPRPST